MCLSLCEHLDSPCSILIWCVYIDSSMGCRYLWVSKPWSSEVSKNIWLPNHGNPGDFSEVADTSCGNVLWNKWNKRKVCQVQVHTPHFDRVSFMKSHQSQQAVRIGAVPSKLSTFGCCVGTVEGSCLLADESHNHHHQTQSKQIIQPANTLRSPNIMFRDHLGVGAGG